MPNSEGKKPEKPEEIEAAIQRAALVIREWGAGEGDLSLIHI